MTQPVLENQGVLDLGENCHLCSKLDFLPFHCEFCEHIYCSEHRNVEAHKCKRPERERLPENYKGPSAASLFPDPKKRQKALEAQFERVSGKQSIAIDKQEKVKSTSLAKLKKFLQIQKTSRGNSSKGLLFNRLKPSKSPNPLAQLAALKKVAKGSPSVTATDRIFIWALYIDRNEEELDQISEATEKVGIWLLRNWSVGRSLDLIADQMKIMNYNNSTLSTNKRLTLFRVVDDEPVVLELSKKNIGSFTNGDLLYLVKG